MAEEGSRLPRLCQVGTGSIFELAPESYDVITSFVVRESVTTLRREFRVAVHALAAALRPGGVLIMNRLVTTGASAGRGFPSVSLTDDDVARACHEARLEVSTHPVGTGNTDPRLVVIVARRPV